MHLDSARLALFLGATLVLLVTPGPSVLYITTRSMGQGLRAGLVSVAAVETGNMVQALVAAVGLAALLASSAMAFSTVKLAGAGYLVYLGVRKMLAGQVDGSQARRGAAVGLRAVYLEGLVVAVLNPKTALFFLAFLPQFVDPARGAASGQMLALGGIFVAMAVVSDSAYALLAGSAGRWLRGHPGLVRNERFLSGAVYIGLGAFTALVGGSAHGGRSR